MEHMVLNYFKTLFKEEVRELIKPSRLGCLLDKGIISKFLSFYFYNYEALNIKLRTEMCMLVDVVDS